jgi:hypothetical protein
MRKTVDVRLLARDIVRRCAMDPLAEHRDHPLGVFRAGDMAIAVVVAYEC